MKKSLFTSVTGSTVDELSSNATVFDPPGPAKKMLLRKLPMGKFPALPFGPTSRAPDCVAGALPPRYARMVFELSIGCASAPPARVATCTSTPYDVPWQVG